MMKLSHKFVTHAPEKLEEGVLYISVEYPSVLHKCCCGCGEEVVTPLSPKGWKLIFDGKTVSLEPSIGNWSYACKSHYWIKKSQVVWARRWSEREVKTCRAKESKRNMYEKWGFKWLEKLFM